MLYGGKTSLDINIEQKKNSSSPMSSCNLSIAHTDEIFLKWIYFNFLLYKKKKNCSDIFTSCSEEN